MARSIDRRSFLRRAGTAAAVLAAAPLARPSRAIGQANRLVVAIGQWGTETPFAWRHVQAEKPLWDCVNDPLILRDPKTFEYRPGLATEWKPSNEMRTWTFKLRPGVKFHEGFGDLIPTRRARRSSCAARCRAPSIRRRGAASTPAARTPRRSARRSSRR